MFSKIIANKSNKNFDMVEFIKQMLCRNKWYVADLYFENEAGSLCLNILTPNCKIFGDENETRLIYKNDFYKKKASIEIIQPGKASQHTIIPVNIDSELFKFFSQIICDFNKNNLDNPHSRRNYYEKCLANRFLGKKVNYEVTQLEEYFPYILSTGLASFGFNWTEKQLLQYMPVMNLLLQFGLDNLPPEFKLTARILTKCEFSEVSALATRIAVICDGKEVSQKFTETMLKLAPIMEEAIIIALKENRSLGAPKIRLASEVDEEISTDDDNFYYKFFGDENSEIQQFLKLLMTLFQTDEKLIKLPPIYEDIFWAIKGVHKLINETSIKEPEKLNRLNAQLLSEIQHIDYLMGSKKQILEIEALFMEVKALYLMGLVDERKFQPIQQQIKDRAHIYDFQSAIERLKEKLIECKKDAQDGKVKGKRSAENKGSEMPPHLQELINSLGDKVEGLKKLINSYLKATTLEELKTYYRRIFLKIHPDKCDQTTTTDWVNFYDDYTFRKMNFDKAV
ncbi:MAG: hypothetical protein PHV30_01510 [Candidatus Margulisbacteria bacterium]|nr:hypothetical protein [Candidatus Margulisiibacteriota bacterium]